MSMFNRRGRGGGSVQNLPPGWEKAYDERTKRPYYVDHNTRTTTWLNPLDEITKPKSVSDCYGDQLPFGWERVIDPIVGTYYTDHVTRINQWTNPVTDWHQRMNAFSQHHYSNSHILSLKQSDNSLYSNDHTKSPMKANKPDISTHTSDMEKSATSLADSTTLDTEIQSSGSNNSTRNSRLDEGLLNIMDNRYGRESSQSVEV